MSLESRMATAETNITHLERDHVALQDALTSCIEQSKESNDRVDRRLRWIERSIWMIAGGYAIAYTAFQVWVQTR